MEPNNKFVSQKMETAAQQLAAQTAAAAIKENSNSVNENSAPPTPSTPSVIVDPMDVLAAAAAKSPTAVVNGTQPSLTTFSDTVKPVPTEVKSPALLSAKPPTEQPVVKTMPTPPQAPVGAPVVTVPAAPVPVPATTTTIVPPSATTTATPAAVSLTATPVPTTSQPSTAASEPPATTTPASPPATTTPAPPATTTTPAPPATTTTPAPPATTTTPAPPATTTTPAPPATTTTPAPPATTTPAPPTTTTPAAPPTTTTPAPPPATTTTSEPSAQENTLGSTETKTHDSSGALPTETTNATSPPQVEKDLNGTSKVTQQESTTTMDVDTPDREPKQSIGSDVGSTAPETTTSQISTPAPVNEKPPAATPAAQPVLRPALRGTYSVGHDGIAEWEGKWGMDDAAFEPGGFVSPFRYRFVKHATPEESETKKIANPKAAAAGLAAPVPPVPEDQKLPLDLRDSFFSGHFIMRPRGVPVKIEERHLFFHFEKKDGSDEVLTVDGQGRNKFGVFVLEGELTVATRQLNVYRRYLPKGKKGGRAKATPRARKSLGNVTPLANAGVLPNPLATALSTGSIPRGLDSDAMVFHPRRPERLRRVPSHLTENDGTNPLGKIANIVHTMMEKDKQSFFCYPVDPVALNIPTYPDIIKEPMDLGTVANNIAEKLYDTELEVVHDVRLTYENAMKFNPASHAIHQIAKDYLKQFDNLFTNLVKEREREAEKQAAKAKKAKESVKAKTPTVTAPKKRKSIGGKKDGKKKKTKKKRSKAVFSSDDDSDADSSSDDSSESSSDESSDDDSSDDETPKKRKKSSKKKKKKKKGKKDDEVARLKAELRSLKKKVEKKERRESVTEVNHTVSAPPTKKRKHIERPLSYQEKHRLTLDIQKLPEDKIQKIISMIQESGAPLDGDDNEVELDIDALETPALRKLQKFVRQCLGK